MRLRRSDAYLSQRARKLTKTAGSTSWTKWSSMPLIYASICTMIWMCGRMTSHRVLQSIIRESTHVWRRLGCQRARTTVKTSKRSLKEAILTVCSLATVETGWRLAKNSVSTNSIRQQTQISKILRSLTAMHLTTCQRAKNIATWHSKEMTVWPCRAEPNATIAYSSKTKITAILSKSLVCKQIRSCRNAIKKLATL